jgi:hypothetical protein
VTEITPATQPAGSQTPPYTSADGHFSVQFPGTPTQGSQDVALPGGQSMTIYQIQYQAGNISYAVAYCDYPPPYGGTDPQATLASVRDAVVKGEKGTLSSDDAISLNGVPGRAYSFTDPSGNTTTIHEFLSGQRLFQVLVTVGSGADATGVNDFLSSFSITAG